MPLTFSFRKTTQALNFFARRSGGAINKMKALKLVYFADRYHLRKYGRPITNDEYFAMNFGPVPSGAKDLAEGSDFRPNRERAYAERVINPADRQTVASVADVDVDVFSASDLEALEFSWNTFGRHDQFRLADITHAYPDWRKHEAALGSESTSRVKMDYSDFLDDAPDAPDPCYALSEDERELRREEVRELAAIHRLWN